MNYQSDYCKLLENYKYVGVNTLVANKNKIIMTTNNGVMSLETKVSLDNDCIFRIASISKVIVAIGAMTLYDQGKLDINEDISKYLGYMVRNPRYPMIPITIKMLMTQTSSISDGADDEKGYDGVNGPHTNISLEDLLTNPHYPYYLDKTFNNYCPGEHWEYSNFGCGILACIIEKISGMYFSDYLRKAVLLPLGIDGSFRISDIVNKDKVVSLYDYQNDFVLLRTKDRFLQGEFPRYELGNNFRMPAGGLFISTIDLAKIMQMMMNKGIYLGTRILKSSTVELMEQVHWQGESDDSMYKKKGLQMIILDQFTKAPLKGHFGSAYGLRSFMLYNNEIGMIFMCNGADYQTDGDHTSALLNDTIKFIVNEYEKKDLI